MGTRDRGGYWLCLLSVQGHLWMIPSDFQVTNRLLLGVGAMLLISWPAPATWALTGHHVRFRLLTYTNDFSIHVGLFSREELLVHGLS